MTGRRWYRLDRPAGAAVSAVVFDVLDGRLTEMTVDVYSYLSAVPCEIDEAERVLRAIRPQRRFRDPRIGLRVTREQPEAWAAARAYAPWSVLVDLFGEEGHLGSFGDSGVVSLRLSPREARALAAELSGQAELAPMNERARVPTD